MALNAVLLAYAVLQFIAFVLVLVATPLDMFRISVNQSLVRGYYSLWGTQQTIGTLTFFSETKTLWSGCSGRLMRFLVGQALAILSIIVFGAAFALGVVMLFCCPLLRWICVMLNILGAITVCVVWVSMVLTYFNNEGRTCPALQGTTVYGLGFVLLLAAWVLDIINIGLLVFPFHFMVFGKNNSDNVNLDEVSKGESNGESKGESKETSSHNEDEEYE